MPKPDPTDDIPSAATAPSPVREAAAEILGPLARLLVARGVTWSVAEEALKVAMIEAARQAQPGGLPHRQVSRIATATGINRREVTRLTRPDGETVRESPSVASAVFMRWRSSAEFLDAQGQPRLLPRQGPAPSFETLARGITQDVHPRSILDELVRLGLARFDAERDEVALARDSFVPAGDDVRMLAMLGANVRDHLAAAVDNVQGRQPRHLERAIFADRLSRQSVQQAEQFLAQQWARLERELVPLLEGLLAQDRAEPARDRDMRLRAGLYVHAADDAATPASAAPVPPSAGPSSEPGAPR